MKLGLSTISNKILVAGTGAMGLGFDNSAHGCGTYNLPNSSNGRSG